jgi:hypothetical protein
LLVAAAVVSTAVVAVAAVAFYRVRKRLILRIHIQL